jgi:hypothetical protein
LSTDKAADNTLPQVQHQYGTDNYCQCPGSHTGAPFIPDIWKTSTNFMSWELFKMRSLKLLTGCNDLRLETASLSFMNCQLTFWWNKIMVLICNVEERMQL